MSSFTQLGSRASESSTSQQVASSVGSSIKQKSQMASPKRPRTSNPEITKKTRSSSKKYVSSKDSATESNLPLDLNLVHKKLSENILQREAI